MNNIQLELALKEAQKQIAVLELEISTLKSASASQVAAEIQVLRDALDRTFRELGSGLDWHHNKRQAAERAAAVVKNGA